VSWQVFRPLDVAAMRQAARPLVGRHDFAAFQAADCESRHAVRDLGRLDVLGEPRGEIAIVAEATAFVKHMVRNIVGTLVEAGLGSRDPASIAALLEGLDRTKAGATAPAHGLCLEEVFY
jgi:tRNA pseudouridine38-40 synthase